MKESIPSNGGEDRSEDLGKRLEQIMAEEGSPKSSEQKFGNVAVENNVAGSAPEIKPNRQENVEINERVVAEREKLENNIDRLSGNLGEMPASETVEKVGVAAERPLSSLSSRLDGLKKKYNELGEKIMIGGVALGSSGLAGMFGTALLMGPGKGVDEVLMVGGAAAAMGAAGFVGRGILRIGSLMHQAWEKNRTYRENGIDPGFIIDGHMKSDSNYRQNE